MELTSIATANHKPLMRAESRTPDEVRDLVSYSDAYSPLADELEALAKFIRYSTTAARNTAGNEALTTYALAVRLSKRTETAYLAPHVADMRRAPRTRPQAVAGDPGETGSRPGGQSRSPRRGGAAAGAGSEIAAAVARNPR